MSQETDELPGGDTIGWVLYDNSCGICRTWVPRWEWLLNRRNLDTAALQEEWVIARLDIPEAERMRDVRLLFRDGSQMTGANVYRYVMKQTWWLSPLWLLTVIPIGKQIFNACYRRFADNRYKISQTCRLP